MGWRSDKKITTDHARAKLLLKIANATNLELEAMMAQLFSEDPYNYRISSYDEIERDNSTLLILASN